MADPTDEGPPMLPRNAVRAARVAMVGVALTIIETILTVADRESLRRRILQHDPASDDVGMLADIAAVSGLLAGLAATVLWFRLIRTIRSGGNWSRATTWALLPTTGTLAVIAFAELTSVLDAVLAGLWGIVIVAVLVLLTIRVVARWT